MKINVVIPDESLDEVAKKRVKELEKQVKTLNNKVAKLTTELSDIQQTTKQVNLAYGYIKELGQALQDIGFIPSEDWR